MPPALRQLLHGLDHLRLAGAGFSGDAHDQLPNGCAHLFLAIAVLHLEHGLVVFFPELLTLGGLDVQFDQEAVQPRQASHEERQPLVALEAELVGDIFQASSASLVGGDGRRRCGVRGLLDPKRR